MACKPDTKTHALRIHYVHALDMPKAEAETDKYLRSDRCKHQSVLLDGKSKF